MHRSSSRWIEPILVAFWVAFWLLAGSIALSTAAFAEQVLPAPLLQEGFKANRVGAGLLTWFGFDIYEASLGTTDGDFANFDPVADAQRQIAFSLWYRRSFSRDRLIEIIQSGWTGFELASKEQQQRWTAQLAPLWEDVERSGAVGTFCERSGAGSRVSRVSWGTFWCRVAGIAGIAGIAGSMT